MHRTIILSSLFKKFPGVQKMLEKASEAPESFSTTESPGEFILGAQLLRTMSEGKGVVYLSEKAQGDLTEGLTQVRKSLRKKSAKESIDKVSDFFENEW